MKKTAIIFMLLVCFFARKGNAQPWDMHLNQITTGQLPNFGTVTNDPINFFTGGMQRMKLDENGVLRIDGLAGSGNRFLQVDQDGNLFPWTGSSANANKVLFGDGIFRTSPFTVDNLNIYTDVHSNLGIGVSNPVAKLDVAGSGNLSGDLDVGGNFRIANNFIFETIAPGDANPMTFRLGPNTTPGVTPHWPHFTYKPPCNVWYKDPTQYDQFGNPYSVVWSPPTSNVFYDLLQVYESNNLNNSVISLGILNQDGILSVEPFPYNTSYSPKLKLNPGCSNDVYICEGGGFTKIFNDAAVVGTLRIGPGAYVSPGSRLDMFLGSADTRAMTIVDPALTSTNKNIFEMSKTGASIFGADVNAIIGAMLTVGQPVKTVPAMCLMDNSVSPSLPFFTVFGDGNTEIRSSNTKALSIKNTSNSNNETFFVNSSGYTEIKVYSPSGMPTPYGAQATRAFTIRDMAANKDIFVVRADGKTYAREVEINLNTTFPDYVFSNEYKLKPIHELEGYISENKHLPGFEKGEYYEKNGINVNDMFVKQQEKIEELALYIIELEKRLRSVEKGETK